MEGQVPPEHVTLPKSGGDVFFRDVEDLDGEAYNRIRDAAAFARKMLMPPSEMLRQVAEVLVTAWSIPGMPNLPLPGSDEGKKMNVLNRLHWKDLRYIHEQLFDGIEVVTSDTPNPTTPPTRD